MENGDPLARKKVKTMPGTSVSMRAPITPQASIEEFPNPSSHPQPPLLCTQRSRADSSDDEANTTPGTNTQSTMTLDAIEVNDSSNNDDKLSDGEPKVEVEDDISELSEFGAHSYSIVQETEPSIDRLSKSWDAPVYAFFKPTPTVQYFKNRKAHVFECAASPCRYKTQFVRRFLYTGDTSSTSNLRRHTKLCWGDEALAAADEAHDVKTARAALRSHKGVNGSITAVFKRVGTGKVTYSHRQHTKIEARYVPNFCSIVIISNVKTEPSSYVGSPRTSALSR
jgi:hypothetical protein